MECLALFRDQVELLGCISAVAVAVAVAIAVAAAAAAAAAAEGSQSEKKNHSKEAANHQRKGPTGSRAHEGALGGSPPLSEVAREGRRVQKKCLLETGDGGAG